jgi:tetratricopeptide (TPR) repeat protein
MLSSRRLLPLLLLLAIASCKNSESWTARQWHNTVAHYNTYFNAREKVRLTENDLRDRFTDRFDKVLEIYNYGDEAALLNNGGTMDEVLKKTSNLVDKHPKSKWVDDAYMLMGESYFLRGDFIAAKDLFQFVYSRFKDKDVKAASQIGVFRCLYMMNKLDDAEGLVSSLSSDKEFPASLRYALDEAKAAIYIRKERYPSAVEPLKRLIAATRNRTRKARLWFILAQVEQRAGKNDEAAAHYARVIKMNPPYEMAFNAQINQVLCINAGQKGDLRQARALLKQMLKDDKNFDYLDQIYFRLGETEARDRNWTKAVEYYNLSLRNSKGNKDQMAGTYLALADYYFSTQRFEKSGLYYDSAVGVLPRENASYNQIAAKSQMLGELVRHLATIREQDSLLRLAADPALLERTVDRLVALDRERQQQQQNQPAPPPPPPGGAQGDPMAGGAAAFPFYNAALRARGYNEFIRIWGQRENRDYWRLKNKRTMAESGNPDGGGSGIDTGQSAEVLPPGIPPDRRRYYTGIPFSEKGKTDAKEKIAQAMVGAGNVYREKLQDCKQANEMYRAFLNRFANHSLEPQVLFNTVKCARMNDDKAEAAKYEKLLAEKFPSSTYVAVLRQQEQQDSTGSKPVSEGDADKVEALYRSMYDAFRAGNYQEVLRLRALADKTYSGNSLQGQFDYLYALTLGYMGDLDKAIVLLRAITSDYSGTPIAVAAADIVSLWESRQNTSESSTEAADTTFIWDSKDDLFFLLIVNRGGDMNRIRAALSDHNSRNHASKALETGRPAVAGDFYTIPVKGFKTMEDMRAYLSQTTGDNTWQQTAGSPEVFCCLISQRNYAALLSSGKVEVYRKLFGRNYK